MSYICSFFFKKGFIKESLTINFLCRFSIRFLYIYLWLENKTSRSTGSPNFLTFDFLSEVWFSLEGAPPTGQKRRSDFSPQHLLTAARKSEYRNRYQFPGASQISF
jgi:hypothetical protein